MGGVESRRGRAVPAMVLVGFLVASACGSTVPEAVGERRDQQEVVADEFGAEVVEGGATRSNPESRASAAIAAGSPDRGGSSAPAPAGPDASGGQAPAPTAATPAGGPIPAGADARGVTDDTIYVGMIHFTEEQQGEQVVGAEPPEQGTADREMGEAVAAYINERGGVAGRKLEIVWYDANNRVMVTPEGRAREAQRACATWTEDNQVFAMLDSGSVSELYFDCARRTNTAMMIYHVGYAVDEQLFAELHPLWYSIDRIIADRRDRNLVESLVRRGVLTSDSKVGIIMEDWEPVKRGVANGMEPALAAHGIEVVAKAAYPDIIESPWDTYVLQFRNAGVTHVLAAQNWDSGALGLQLMMRGAENQGYRPIWGLGSDNRPHRLASDGAPRAQLANTFVMGFLPADDVGQYEETERRAQCREAAQEPIGPNYDVKWSDFCDLLFFFKALLERAPEISPAGMHAAKDALADSYNSVGTIGGLTSFAAGRGGGVAVQRDLVYNPECNDDGVNCWRYTGPTRPLR